MNVTGLEEEDNLTLKRRIDRLISEDHLHMLRIKFLRIKLDDRLRLTGEQHAALDRLIERVRDRITELHKARMDGESALDLPNPLKKPDISAAQKSRWKRIFLK